MQYSSYSKTASWRQKSLQALEDTSRALPSCACTCAEAGLGQKGLLCPTVWGKTLEANGEREKCFFFIPKASNSLVKRVCIFMVLPQRLLLPFFLFCLAFSLPLPLGCDNHVPK